MISSERDDTARKWFRNSVACSKSSIVVFSDGVFIRFLRLVLTVVTGDEDDEGCIRPAKNEDSCWHCRSTIVDAIKALVSSFRGFGSFVL